MPVWIGCEDYLVNALQVFQKKVARVVTKLDRVIPTKVLMLQYGWLSVNPIIPSVLKTNEIPGGEAPGAPPMKNNEGVILGPYHQKTFWKGTNFRLI